MQLHKFVIACVACNWILIAKPKKFSSDKTDHGSNLGKATTFPLIVYFVFGHGTSTQMSFYPEIPEIGIPATLGAHNFVCKWHVPKLLDRIKWQSKMKTMEE
jgi:hypothetical protein